MDSNAENCKIIVINTLHINIFLHWPWARHGPVTTGRMGAKMSCMQDVEKPSKTSVMAAMSIMSWVGLMEPTMVSESKGQV